MSKQPVVEVPQGVVASAVSPTMASLLAAKIAAARSARVGDGNLEKKNPVVPGTLLYFATEDQMVEALASLKHNGSGIGLLVWDWNTMVDYCHDPKPNKDGKIGASQVVTINHGQVILPDGTRARGGNYTISFPL